MKSSIGFAKFALRECATAILVLGVPFAQNGNAQGPDEAPPPPLLVGKTANCVPATPLGETAPKYPKEAWKAKMEGSVELRVTIDETGGVKDVRVIRGDPPFIAAATDAARDWRFRPALLNGKPVEGASYVKVEFTRSKAIKKSLAAEFMAVEPNCTASPLASVLSQPTGADAGKTGPIYELNGQITPPQPIYSPHPNYNEKARKAGVQGIVKLELTVTREGDVAKVKLLKSLDPELDQRAVDTVQNWKFKPATLSGSPVAVRIAVEVDFHLVGGM